MPRWQRIAVPVALALLGVSAWWPTRPVGFVFDDRPLIVENPLVAGGDVLGMLTARHATMANRPLTGALLAAQAALFGGDAFRFRCFSVLLHVVNAWLLFGVLRAALPRPARRAHWCAAAVAAVWVAHPLAADTVAYAAQQSMLLTALFALLALRCLQRAVDAPMPQRWRWGAMVAAAAALASKEEYAALPIVLLLHERAFRGAQWRSLLRSPLGIGLVATWAVLLWCATGGSSNVTAGYHVAPGVDALEWLQTEAAVVLDYLRLVLWPAGQRSYYDWPIERSFAAAAPAGVAVLALLAASMWAWRRWPRLAWLLTAFFLLLAPTSTILPIPSEVAAERRMYLPMLAVLVPLALVATGMLGRLPSRARGLAAAALTALLVLGGVVAARGRLPAYADDLAFWREAFERGDAASLSYQRAIVLTNYGIWLRDRGDRAQSDPLFERAMQCEAVTPSMLTFYAVSLNDQGRRDDALQVVQRALAMDPAQSNAHALMASILMQQHFADHLAGRAASDDPRLRAAEQHARAAVAANPRRGPFVATLARIVDLAGRAPEAEGLYRTAIALAPERAEAAVDYAGMLRALGRRAEAAQLWQQILASRPDDAVFRRQVAEEMLRRGDPALAAELLRDAARLSPGDAQVQALLRDVERRLPK